MWVIFILLRFDSYGLFLVPAAMFLAKPKISTQGLLKIPLETFTQSLVTIFPLVSDEKMLENVYGRWWDNDGRRTLSDGNSSNGLSTRWTKKESSL